MTNLFVYCRKMIIKNVVALQGTMCTTLHNITDGALATDFFRFHCKTGDCTKDDKTADRVRS